jgi:hypothetical protein
MALEDKKKTMDKLKIFAFLKRNYPEVADDVINNAILRSLRGKPKIEVTTEDLTSAKAYLELRGAVLLLLAWHIGNRPLLYISDSEKAATMVRESAAMRRELENFLVGMDLEFKVLSRKR